MCFFTLHFTFICTNLFKINVGRRKYKVLDIFSPHVIAGVEEGGGFAGEETRCISPQRGVDDDGPTFSQEDVVVIRCRWVWYSHMEVPGGHF